MSERVGKLGDLSAVPHPVENPSFEGLDLSPSDWFILSRVDGRLAFRELIALSPTSRQATIEALIRLFDVGLISVPSAGAAPGEAGASSPVRVDYQLGRPSGWPVAFDDFEFDPALLAVDVPLSDTLKREIIYYHAHLDQLTYYQLLDVRPDAAHEDVRRRYFAISKAVHPDRFFRKDLGPFREMLTAVFRAINEAHKVLGHRRRRREYDAELRQLAGRPQGVSSERGPVERPPSRPLATLLKDAKQAERAGDYRAAFELYEQALNARRSAELMNRSAECLIRLKERLDLAEERASAAVKAAPELARYWVALAYVRELRGNPREALRGYERALELDPHHEGAKLRIERLRNRSG